MREGLQKVLSDDETIVAISTPLGTSGIGVVRISGRECLSIATQFFKPHSQNCSLQHRLAVVGSWHDADGVQIDEVVITFFRGPNSYTGEDVLEISAHGSPLALRRVVGTAIAAGARLAVPGEFTLRAVAHGKMDLVQAEGVRDFIESQTELQARNALRQMQGSLSRRVRPVKDDLIDVVAGLEAGIDFAEDDIELPSNPGLVDTIRDLRVKLEQLKDTFGFGKILAQGLRLAIVGKPNVGKSSLFNRLVSSDRAIVTSIPGTTRDVLTETIDLDGVPITFADTAGIRQTRDEVESIGVTRTFETVSEADLALILFDGASFFDDDDRQALSRGSSIPHLIIVNKIDLPQVIDAGAFNGSKRLFVSAKTGQGFEEIRRSLQTFLFSGKSPSVEDSVLTNARQHEVVSIATEALKSAEQGLSCDIPHEMVLLDLYRALGALGELTGDVVTEDILDRIFSSFCIGK